MNQQQGTTGVGSGTKQTIVFIVLAVAIVFFFLFVFSKAPKGTKIIKEGDQAPEFTLKSMDGKSVNLSQFRGKAVMVHFWATWCPPCVDEIPTLEKLYRTLMGSNFEMLAISVDDGGDAVRSFMQRNKLSLPVFLDPGKSVSASYGTFKFPETYILDRNGRVRYKMIGPANWDDPAAVKALQELAAEK